MIHALSGVVGGQGWICKRCWRYFSRGVETGECDGGHVDVHATPANNSAEIHGERMYHMREFHEALDDLLFLAKEFGVASFKVWEGDRLSGEDVTIECKGRIVWRDGWLVVKLQHAPDTMDAPVLRAFTDRLGKYRSRRGQPSVLYTSELVGERLWDVNEYDWKR